MSTVEAITDDPREAIRKIGQEVVGKLGIVIVGRLVSGNVTTPWFVREDELLGTIGFDDDSCQFYLQESPDNRIERVHQAEYDNDRLFIDGWRASTWTRWVVSF